MGMLGYWGWGGQPETVCLCLCSLVCTSVCASVYRFVCVSGLVGWYGFEGGTGHGTKHHFKDLVLIA